MYDIYWYGSVHFRTAHRAEACVELARMFACTYLAFNEASVAEWIAEGSGISFDEKPLNTFGYLCEGQRLAEMANSYEYHNAATWRRGPVQGGFNRVLQIYSNVLEYIHKSSHCVYLL